jgi:gas vesicle protein
MQQRERLNDDREPEPPRTPEPADANGFVAGLLTGALLGAALAMLLAPASGEEMRDLLRAKAREATNRARDAVADINDCATDVYSRKTKNPDDVM